MEPFKPGPTPAELRDAQAYGGDGSAIAISAGLSLVVIGGSAAALAGERHHNALRTGQVIWAAGVALIGAGTKMFLSGNSSEATN